MRKRRFQIVGMDCVACSITIDGEVEDLSGVISATTSYAKQRTDVTFDESKVTEKDILAAIKRAGYSALPLQKENI